MRLHDYTAFQRDLLVIVYDMDEPSGQDIKSVYERVMSAEVTHGQLYPNLDRLVDSELVQKGQLDRRTNYYEVTEEGRKAIEQFVTWQASIVGVHEHTHSDSDDEDTENSTKTERENENSAENMRVPNGIQQS